MTVFKIVHEQALAVDEHNQVSEIRPWTRIELGYTAIERRWFARFKPNWIDLPVLMAIGLHARPLIGDDFKRLLDLGLVEPGDQGRLYARITDVALADILDCSREWVNKSAGRLGDKHLLRVLPLPTQFRDSRGLFAGNNAYLLPGDVLVQSRPSDLIHVNSVHMDKANGVNSVHMDGVNSARTKIYRPSVLTLSDESGAQRAPADSVDNIRSDSASDLPALATGIAADWLTPGLAGNAPGAKSTDGAAGTASRGDRLVDELNGALTDPQMTQAFQGLLGAIKRLSDGFNEESLCMAALMLTPLPDRRRQVLDDMRRLQGNDQIKPNKRKRYLIGLLTQQIAGVIGLGLDPRGRLRVVPGKADYNIVGGLINEYGAEAVWLTACAIAGQPFEGDPIEYLRAALRNKRERERGVGVPASRNFDNVDYLSEQVGIGT